MRSPRTHIRGRQAGREWGAAAALRTELLQNIGQAAVRVRPVQPAQQIPVRVAPTCGGCRTARRSRPRSDRCRLLGRSGRCFRAGARCGRACRLLFAAHRRVLFDTRDSNRRVAVVAFTRSRARACFGHVRILLTVLRSRSRRYSTVHSQDFLIFVAYRWCSPSDPVSFFLVRSSRILVARLIVVVGRLVAICTYRRFCVVATRRLS